MAKPVTDAYNAVDPAKVTAVTRPASESVWWLNVSLDYAASPLTLYFASLEARDTFFKELVSAMAA